MTRTTNARIAGFTYLFYAAIGICIELLMHQARDVTWLSARTHLRANRVHQPPACARNAT
jgi:hypothetical protein